MLHLPDRFKRNCSWIKINLIKWKGQSMSIFRSWQTFCFQNIIEFIGSFATNDGLLCDKVLFWRRKQLQFLIEP